MPRAVSEYHDIQAILHTGFGSLEEASFLLLRIQTTHVGEAKAWLAAVAREPGAEKLSYHVTSAKHSKDERQDQVLQIAFTPQGLCKLGVPADCFPKDTNQGPASDRIHTFSRQFYSGLAGEQAEKLGRPRRLGDIGKNAPCEWEWGGSPEQLPDVVLLLYADEGHLAAFQRMVIADIALGFEVIGILHAADVPIAEEESKLRREPFGFLDGVSQPVIDWDGERKPGTRADLEYGNLISVGEFLLGYQNEYGQYTRRPLIDPGLDPQNILPPAEDFPQKRDLGRNGTYLVFRHLEQDVHGFWRFVNAQSPEDGGIGLAEAMVGRSYVDGDPLVPVSLAAIRGVGPKADDLRLNNFTFGADPDALACPYGAHIRRANPRNSDMPGGSGQSLLSWLLQTLGLTKGGPREDLLSSSRFHRIIRRGRSYGAQIDREDALKGEEPGFSSGLYFLALNANISRQFEFIQNAWIVSSKFDGLDRESDPLLGNREPTPFDQPTDEFSLPQATGITKRICGVPQFITVRGGAYFFLPGIRALRYIARLKAPG
ncbi:MAG TPA: peroxidase [Methylocella sp.]|nr:peroxidase [Methylocella sp.]